MRSNLKPMGLPLTFDDEPTHQDFVRYRVTHMHVISAENTALWSPQRDPHWIGLKGHHIKDHCLAELEIKGFNVPFSDEMIVLY